jgi:lantibiotic leader peptide-processing serine protease
MIKNLFKTAVVLVLMASCNKQQLQQPTTSSKNTGAVSLSADNQIFNSTSSYIIRTAGNSDADLAPVRARIAQIGATETGHLNALNMLFVSSSSPDFEAAMSGLQIKIGANLKLLSPTSAITPQLAGDNPPSTGDSNPLFGYQWGMDAIDAPQAWNSGYLGAGAKVAVIDVGIYLNHPDLAANLLPSQGHNFVNLEDLGSGLCATYPECNPSDPGFKATGFSHATHVAGIIAAVDNNIGVIGVAPSAKIIPVKCLSDFAGFGLTSWIASGIVYATDQHVDVINMSLGGVDIKGYGKGSNLVQEGIKAFKDAIAYAYNNGVTVVCAAGNDAIDMDHTGSVVNLPGADPHALAISATSPYGFAVNQGTDLDVPASYTDYGSSYIDFAAPGGDFDYPSSLYVYDMVLSTGGPTNYYFAAGTSMAAPHVSGVAALIIGKYGHGALSPAQVQAKLRSGADDLGKPGKDPWFGLGRVNAYKSLK